MANIDTLIEEIRNFRADVNGRLNTLDKRMSALHKEVDTRFGSLNLELDARFLAIDKGLKGVNRKLESLDRNIEIVREQTALNSEEITTLRKRKPKTPSA